MRGWGEERGWVFDLQRFVNPVAKATLLSTTALPAEGETAYYTVDANGGVTKIAGYTGIIGDGEAGYAVTAGNYLKISQGVDDDTYTIITYTIGDGVAAESQDEDGFAGVLIEGRKATLTALALGTSEAALGVGGKAIVSTGSTITGYISIATSGSTATLNDAKYKAAANTTKLTIGESSTELTDGTLTLDGAGTTSVKSIVVGGSTIATTTGSVNVTSGGVVSDLTANDVFTIASGDPLVTTTYTVYAGYVVGTSDEDTPTVSSYKLASGEMGAATFETAGTATLTKLTAAAIAITSGSTTDVSYTADGLEVPAAYDGVAATFTAATAEASAKFAATSKVTPGVSITGIAVDVTDAATGTQYTLGASGPVVTSTNSFSVDASSNITATGTKLNVVSGTLVSKDEDGVFDLVASSGDATPSVKFAQTTTTNNAKITVTGGTIILTEGTNDTADTVIAKDGSITGLDAGGIVTGVPTSATVQPAEEAGTYQVNGKAFQLAAAADNAIKAISATDAVLYKGIASLSSTSASEAATLQIGDTSATTVSLQQITTDAENAASASVVVANGVVTSVADLTANGAISGVSAGKQVAAKSTPAVGNAYAVNGKYYEAGAAAALTIMALESGSYLYTGTVTIDTATDDAAGSNNNTVEIGTASAKNASLTVTDGSATVKASNGDLAANDGTEIVLAESTVITGIPSTHKATTEAASGKEYTVNGIKFTTASADATIVSVNADGDTLTASADITTGTKDKNYTLNGVTFSSVSEGVLLEYTSKKATLNADEYVTVGTCDKLTVLSTGANGNGAITIDSTGAVGGSNASSAGKFVVGDSFTLGSVTYTFKDDSLVVQNAGTRSGVYTVSDISTVTITDGAGTQDTVSIGGQDIGDLTPSSTPLKLNSTTTTNTFDANGIMPAVGTAIGKVTKNSDKNYSLMIESALTAGSVEIDGVQVAITDKNNSGTKYIVDTSGKAFTVNGTATVDADDVLTSASGTITLESNTALTTKAAGAAYVVSNTGTGITFVAGTSLNSTAVTTQVGTVKITESSNTTATTVASDGAVTGIDGSAAITGAATGQIITTTGDGTVSINGTSWTVAGSASGVTYTADADTKGRVSSITGSDGNALTKGTTVSTTDDISGSTVNGITVTSATKGLSITQTEAESASVTLSNSGDEIANASGTFKVNTAGNGVTVASDGTVSGLTDGEKVTVTNGTTTTVYEVTGNTLVTTQTDSSTGTDVTTTYTSILADGETDGFTVALGGKIATNATKEADKTADTTGFTLGGTAVDTVTTDMMVDASGNATTSSEKAVAEVTIQNDGTEIKYTSKQDKKQTVAVTTGTTAANKEWDITTGGGSDVITFAGAKDATINAGDGNNNVTLTNTGDVSVVAGSGNDEITINGTGDALVSVAGGRNVINHTGAGTASIAGGTGNDTISSTNEDDLIYGGAGNNTFQMNAGVTNKISDFTFGADKAALAGVTGTLDAGQVVVDVDGTIAYGDKATSGAIDVSAETFDGYYAVSIADQNGKHKINVGWTGGNGGMINASGLTEKTLLIGNSEGKADTLMGGSAGDTLKAGTGEASLWGGAGNDTLVSGTEASTSFFFLAGDGQDKVQGFKAYTEETKDTADVLDFYGQGISSVMLTDSGIKVTKGTDSMTLVGSYDANTMVQWRSGEASGVAKIGKNAETNSFTYDGAVTNYLGGTKTDTVSVSDDGAGVNVWMDGSRGVGYDSIEVLDASSVTGKATLAGGAGSNTITGGTGDSSLWGGADGSDDVLNAGSGTNTFFYGLGNGNDVVNGTKEGDTVNLFNLNLSDLTSAVIEDSKITVTQANGQTLTVNGQANTFTLADGTTWRADHSTKTWSQAQ